jgi:hypothetical protein
MSSWLAALSLKEISMTKTRSIYAMAAAAGVALALRGAGTAQARDVYWSVGGIRQAWRWVSAMAAIPFTWPPRGVCGAPAYYYQPPPPCITRRPGRVLRPSGYYAQPPGHYYRDRGHRHGPATMVVGAVVGPLDR